MSAPQRENFDSDLCANLDSQLIVLLSAANNLPGAEMKYRKLGRTGLDVSDMAHGLWGMSGWSGSEDRESLDALQMAVDQGCNFFDTTWAYGEGKSDALLGQIKTRNRGKQLYAASKKPPKKDQKPTQPNNK